MTLSSHQITICKHCYIIPAEWAPNILIFAPILYLYYIRCLIFDHYHPRLCSLIKHRYIHERISLSNIFEWLIVNQSVNWALGASNVKSDVSQAEAEEAEETELLILERARLESERGTTGQRKVKGRVEVVGGIWSICLVWAKVEKGVGRVWGEGTNT